MQMMEKGKKYFKLKFVPKIHFALYYSKLNKVINIKVAEFTETHYPDVLARDRLSNITGLTDDKIQV